MGIEENDNGQIIKSMINWFMGINEIEHIDHFYTPYTSNPSVHYVAG